METVVIDVLFTVYCRAEKDSVAAEKMMSEMILEEQRARIAREMQDQVRFAPLVAVSH